MARPLLPLALLALFPLPSLPSPPPGNASLHGCPPGRFQCELGDLCFPLEWRCDGHPDCEDERDEKGCGTTVPVEPSPDGARVTPPRSSALPPTASLPGCPPGRFQCELGDLCFPLEWRCDGHPDCEDEQDEKGCGTTAPAEPSPDGARVTPPRSSALPPPPTGGAESSAMPVLESSVPLRSQGHLWILVIAVILSVLVAVGSVAVWGLSKAKSRADIFSLEKASREQLMPDENQTGSFP